MEIDERLIDSLVSLRRSIHMEPELAGKEYLTVKKINDFVRSYNPDKTIQEIGKSGIAYIYRGVKPGPTILLRADIDALPINETTLLKYQSLHKNISHKCGHDGHAAILCGVAAQLFAEKLKKGKVILLFQPSEENGQGAKLVLDDKRFNEITPDYVFAFHNLPGYPLGSVIIKEDVFAMASKGIHIILNGKSSHASEPEKGKSPMNVFVKLLGNLEKIPMECCIPGSMLTICHAKLGEPSYGISPGFAEIQATIRCKSDADMNDISEKVLEYITKETEVHKLTFDYSWTEEFPATVNNNKCIEWIRQAANSNALETVFISKPFRWSEDFGHFTSAFPGAYFGLGAGDTVAALHHADYDFPDKLIKSGIQIYMSLLNQVL